MQAIRDINNRYWQQCLGFHKLALVYTGFWPMPTDEQNRYLKFAQSLPYLAIGGTTVAFLVMIYDLTFKLRDYLLLAESVSYMMTLSKAMLICTIAFLKRQDIVEIFSMSESFNEYIIDEEEKVVFQRCRRKAKWYSIVNVCVWCGYSLIVDIIPMFEVERRLPVNLNLPLESPLYEVWYIGVVAAGCGSILIVSACDSFIISAFMYFTAYLQILQYKLEHGQEIVLKRLLEEMVARQARNMEEIFANGNIQGSIPYLSMISNTDAQDLSNVAEESGRPKVIGSRSCRGVQTPRMELQQVSGVAHYQGGNTEVCVIDIGSSDDEESGDVTSENTGEMPEMKTNMADRRDLEAETCCHLVYCVKLHNEIMCVIARTLNRISYVLCLDLVLGALSVCLSMLLIKLVPFGSFDTFLWSVYFCLILEELFGYCWASSKLQAESVQVSDALYLSDWTEASPSYKRSMLIMMSRAVRPLEISTMNFLTFDMDMFRRVVNSGYSCFNLMSEMHNKK